MNHRIRRTAFPIAAALAIAVSGAGTAMAGTPACRNPANFDRWLAEFSREAAQAGIPRQVIAASLNGISYDQNVVRRDRGQRVFQQSFLQFAARMTGGGRHKNGLNQMKRHAALLGRIEKRFGVPAPVITALWGLESDYGAYKGASFNVIQAVATLAFDCRRADFFRGQLMDALRIVQRGDLRADEMIGNWAGELGPTQFIPSGYYQFGVDFDGDGRVDMIRSVPDALASAANKLREVGWRPGEPWLQEVRVPTRLPWEQADLEIQHPRAQWVRWGVRSAHGPQLPPDNLPASLLLPMGRNGPAFLAYNNFKAFREWNAAFVYATTAAYFATRLAGAPVVGKGNGQVDVLTTEQVRDLQRLLVHHRLLKGEVDGRFGAMSRAATKQAQLRVGLPADSYPTVELIERLRRVR